MKNIEGFGTAEWSVMMSSVSFPLEGTDAFIVIQPEDTAASSPAWPGQIGRILAHGEAVTADKVRAAFPNLSAVVWNARIIGFMNSVECLGLFDGLRIGVASHIRGVALPTEDQLAKKHAELRVLAEKFLAIIVP